MILCSFIVELHMEGLVQETVSSPVMWYRRYGFAVSDDFAQSAPYIGLGTKIFYLNFLCT